MKNRVMRMNTCKIIMHFDWFFAITWPAKR